MRSKLAGSVRRITFVGTLAGCPMLGAAPPAHAAASGEKPAASMLDLRDHFAACFQPPRELRGTRVTFYFALNTKGRVLAQPRTALFDFKGSDEERRRRLAGFDNDFQKCLPLSMNATLASTIPGKTYFLQYIVADKGSEVLLRPFGSHYFGSPGPGLGVAPLSPSPGFEGPRTAPVEIVRARPVQRFRPFVGPLPQLLRQARAQARRDMRFGPRRPIR